MAGPELNIKRQQRVNIFINQIASFHMITLSQICPAGILRARNYIRIEDANTKIQGDRDDSINSVVHFFLFMLFLKSCMRV